MRKIVIIVGILILIALAAWFVYSMRGDGPSAAPDPDPFGGTTSLNGQGGQLISIQTDSGTITVPDFTRGRPAVEQTSGTYYYVTQDENHQEENPNFGIVYGSDSSISIGLFAEPLSAARLEAEARLKQLIPASNETLCSMDITVMVPPDVSEIYAGDELGLSFCPGAVRLP